MPLLMTEQPGSASTRRLSFLVVPSLARRPLPVGVFPCFPFLAAARFTVLFQLIKCHRCNKPDFEG